MAGGRSAGIAAALLVACGGGKKEPPPPPSPSAVVATSASIGGGVVARVGTVELPSALVVDVARTQSLDARGALDALVAEAIVAEAARANGAFDDPKVKQEVAGALARRVIARFDAEAHAQGPITDDELVAAVGEAWPLLDKPETRVAVHALVKKGTPDGAALAESLRASIASISGSEEFVATAKKFQAPAGTVVAEHLPPITEDGRIALVGGGTIDAGFAKAAFAIPEVGGTSPVVETPFGWHVIRLVTITPPHRAGRDELLERLEGEVVRRRLQGTFDALLASLHAAVHPQVSTDLDDDLMTPRFDVEAPP